MRAELECTTRTLLAEIGNPHLKRRHVAATYALALHASEETDWKQVNEAIIKRWSFSALEWIKKEAWRLR